MNCTICKVDHCDCKQVITVLLVSASATACQVCIALIPPHSRVLGYVYCDHAHALRIRMYSSALLTAALMQM